jgi:hypothetical protein
MLQRHSSRRIRLDHAVLTKSLKGAVSYDRIAGYFRSSLFEVAGEAVTSVPGPVRIICNSDLDPQDVSTAAALKRLCVAAGVQASRRMPRLLPCIDIRRSTTP